MAPKAVELARCLLEALKAEETVDLMGPSMAEVAEEGLDAVFPCCARLQIPAALREAITTWVGKVNYSHLIF